MIAFAAPVSSWDSDFNPGDQGQGPWGHSGDKSQRAAGLFRVILRIDGESLVIFAGHAGLLKCFDIGEKVFLSGAVRTKLGRIKILCNQLAELSFGAGV
jgi:hypothetical protein